MIVRTVGIVSAGVYFFSPPVFLRQEPRGQQGKLFGDNYFSALATIRIPGCRWRSCFLGTRRGRGR